MFFTLIIFASGCSNLLQSLIDRRNDACRAPSKYRPSFNLIGSVSTAAVVYRANPQGRYVYLNLGQQFSIADVSNPRNPTILSTVAIPSADWAIDSALASNNILWIASGGDGIRSMNVSNPYAPSFIAQGPGAPGWANTILLKSNNRAIVSHGNRGVTFIDISNPASFSVTYAVGAGANLGPSSGAVVGDYGYFAYGGSGGVTNKEMRIYDVSSSTTSTLKSTFSSPTGVNDLAIYGNYAYLATIGGGLQIVDVSNVSSPQLVNTYTTGTNVYTVRAENKLAVIQTSGNDIQLLDISNPANPIFITSYTLSSGTLGAWARMDFSCNLLYAGNGNTSSLLIFDLYNSQ
ncbi:MAG: hypothetical protein IPM57_05510 [Oligoflexia bacterium]|nr:hypothetical protein [Oligoflexia bacterium]